MQVQPGLLYDCGGPGLALVPKCTRQSSREGHTQPCKPLRAKPARSNTAVQEWKRQPLHRQGHVGHDKDLQQWAPTHTQ